MLLLTDGTVMCQASGGKDWWRLTPDQHGDYVHGTWTQLSSMAHSRLYYASAVLDDGRVFVAGGEYSDGGSEFNGVEIYDPYLDTWTTIPGPGWANIGDAVTCVLPDGRLLLGNNGATQMAIFDPATQAWSASGVKDDVSSEETWTLLPDQSVLTIECSNSPKAEKYLPSANTWVSAGSTPVPIVEVTWSIEIGPALLLPDGRVFCVGGTGHTALYTPPATPSLPGTWTAGPDFPQNPPGQRMKANDAPGCLLPNGNVLCTAGIAGDTGWANPTSFFEYDPTANTLTAISNPTNAAGVVYGGRLLLLPTGQVLFAHGGPDIEVYTPSGGPQAAWRPVITSHPRRVLVGGTHVVSGRQLNGLSQAVSYGDDAQMATNYPLVRLRHHGTGRVTYCPTFDHSTMAVATGAAIESTYFEVPWDAQPGASDLSVVANGISSASVPVVVKVEPARFGHYEAWNMLIGSLADGPLWVLGPHGPRPVGPFNGRLTERANAAYAKMKEAITELEVLGGEVGQLRAKVEQERLPEKPSGERRRKVAV